MKNLVGKKLTQKAKFLGEEIVINKLPLGKVFDIQEAAKAAGTDEKGQMGVMLMTFQYAVAGAEDLTLEDMLGWPLDELQELSEQIMTFSGLGNAKKAE
jgi:hypothetical protein